MIESLPLVKIYTTHFTFLTCLAPTILIHSKSLHCLAWDEAQGAYVETAELLGYKAVDWLGQIIAFGESRELAYENALEAISAALDER